jgi:hypothetical protein
MSDLVCCPWGRDDPSDLRITGSLVAR